MTTEHYGKPDNRNLVWLASAGQSGWFMEAHATDRVQLIFTTHEDTIMDQKLFRRDEIWFVERDNQNASQIYSFDRFKERYDKKLSKAYLEGNVIKLRNQIQWRNKSVM